MQGCVPGGWTVCSIQMVLAVLFSSIYLLKILAVQIGLIETLILKLVIKVMS